MRRQLYAIVILGLLALAMLGGAAFYLTGHSPALAVRQQLARSSEREILQARVLPPGPGGERPFFVHAAPRPEDAAVLAVPELRERRAFELALATDEVLSGRRSGSGPDVIRVRIGDGPDYDYPRQLLGYRRELEEMARRLQPELSARFGTPLELRVVQEDRRWGLEVTGRPVPPPSATPPTASAAGTAAGGPAPRAGALPEPRQLAHAIYRTTRRFAFIRLIGFGPGGPATIEPAELFVRPRSAPR
ncbi:MAG: hypothetical protein KatS3mg102_2378 [Planctomycetota bacterium]|nr:MAG: hypothetical protein KatS3mg102_2378 [Planctomycetota bacterium]